MPRGARTPEELEALLEDAFVLRDLDALAQLFESTGVLAPGGGLPEARGRAEIARIAAEMVEEARPYVSDPRRIVQVGATALVLGEGAVNVVRRDDGCWRYAISFLDPDRACGCARRPDLRHLLHAPDPPPGTPKP